mmetsp:Transcript_58561/g.104122  ORF Transcript_58561/g.104122 Transcript_58561/m.104122 type:complete len:389 (-) Transcript_58561:147-1313(-)
MGCMSSKSTEQPALDKDRRRLTVGTAEGSTSAQAASSTPMTAADKKTLDAIDGLELMGIIKDQLGEDAGKKTFFSSMTDLSAQSFAAKTTAAVGDDTDFPGLGISFTCRKGLKPESPNQDSFCVLKMDSYSIYAVFDGHGQKGHDVSQFVKERLPKIIFKDSRCKVAKDIGACLVDSFKLIQSMVEVADKGKILSAQMSGTTATLAFHDHKNKLITIAHVADSTAAVGQKVGDGPWNGKSLTRDHKPNLPDEKERIEKAGGRVVFDGYANHRIYAKNQRYPGLNMSRCLGDLLGHHECGITCEPEISELKVEGGVDQILLVCSDGVWEFLSAQEAVDLVSPYPSSKCVPAADALAKEAWDRWIKEEGSTVVDDITVGLVYLGQDATSV